MAAQMRSYRPLAIGRRGAVAANHPLAAQAGLLALRAGGNAIDAAVATAAALAVVEPMMSGLGGDGFYHVYQQWTGRAVVFNGTGPAPAAATPERYAGGIPRVGPLSVSVPGTLAGLDMMHRKFGRLPWPELFAEAIGLARDGFAATRAYRHFADEYRETLLVDPRAAAIFLADGKPPALGARDRPARSRPHPRRDCRRRRRNLLSRPAGAAAGGRSRSRRGAGPGERPRKPSRPRSRRRSRSTIAAIPCSRRRPIRPASCCSRS